MSAMSGARSAGGWAAAGAAAKNRVATAASSLRMIGSSLGECASSHRRRQRHRAGGRCNRNKPLEKWRDAGAPVTTEMSKPRIRKSMIGGREIFVCDGTVDPLMMQRVGALVKSMHYVRTEKSRAGVPGYVAVCDIAQETIAGDPFLRHLRQMVETLLPNEQ